MENSKSLRWWIVEDALRDRKGHWAEYLATFQRGLARTGDTVQFFASKECESEVARAFDAKPVLPKSIWARMSDGAPKWRRMLRIPAHGLATYRAVSRLLSRLPKGHLAAAATYLRFAKPRLLPHGSSELPDIIFVPTVLVHHLLGWLPLIKWRLRKLPCRVLLFFPNAPVDLNDDGVAHLLPDPTAKLFRMCIRFLANQVASGKVILGAETKPMTKALSEVTGVPFTYLPHPVEISGISPLKKRQMSIATEENPIVFGCYGAARHEKGSDILQRAIRAVLERKPELPARFVFQWTGNFTDAEGRTVILDPWLRDHPKVQVVQRLFPEGGYEEQLAKTDVMLLPYREPYRLRVSRVVVEAMVHGIPTLVTAGTTLCDQAQEFGVAVCCMQNSPPSLAEAICRSVEEIQLIRASAASTATKAQSHFSVACFRELLVQGPVKTKNL